MALIAIFSTLAILMVKILVFKGAPHIPLFIGISITAIFSLLHGHKWINIQNVMVQSVAVSLPVLGIFTLNLHNLLRGICFYWHFLGHGWHNWLSLVYSIDYEKMGRDMELSGDIFTIETGYREVHTFWSH